MKIKFLILAFALCLLTVVSGQKVALVLSGGGAKGTAHIGVIRALEEEGIPIDFIAGTSAGAIVGGMYAAGLSPDQMEALFRNPEFSSWVTGEINEEYIYYFKKRKPNPNWVRFKFEWDSIFSPSLPINIVSPYQMDFAFIELFSQADVPSKGNFDSLFVPFRCVATNLNQNIGQVLKSGSLRDAIRASMTYPFYFKPIKIDGNVMYDGGMRNNFPSDVAIEEFNPDVIIGSKVASSNEVPNTDNIFSIVENMLMFNEQFDLLCGYGVLIEPKVENIAVTDFSKADIFIKNGYNAAKAKIHEIRMYVHDSVPQWQVQLKRKQFVDKKAAIYFDEVNVQGLDHLQSEFLKNQLLKRKDSVSISELKKEYFKIIADDKIRSIYPSIVYNSKTNKYTFNANVEKSENFELQFGGNISSSTFTTFFLELQYKQFDIQGLKVAANAYLGRFYNSATANVRMDYPGEKPFYQEVTIGFNNFNYFNTSQMFFGDETPSYMKKNENFLNFNFSFPSKLTNKAKLDFGMNIATLSDSYYQTFNFTRLDTYDENSMDMISVYVQREFNTLDKPQYATSGQKLTFQTLYVNGFERNTPGSTSPDLNAQTKSHNWFTLKINYENYAPISKIWRMGIYGDCAFSNQQVSATYVASKLRSPAFLPLPQSQAIFLRNYRDYNYIAMGWKNIFKVYKSVDFRIETYGYLPFTPILKNDNGTAQIAEVKDCYKYASFIGSAGLVYGTKVGPLSLTVDYYSNYEDNLMFGLNFGYILFNKRPLY